MVSGDVTRGRAIEAYILDLLRRPTTWLRGMVKEPLFTSSLNLVLNGVVSSGLGFVFIFIVARWFAAPDVGLYSALISSAGLIAVLSRMGLDMGIMRFLPSSSQPNDLVNSCMFVAMVTSMVLGVAFLFGMPIWAPGLAFIGGDPLILLLFLAYGSVAALMYMQYSFYVAEGLTALIVKRDVVRDGVKIALVVAAVPLGVVGILGASVSALIISFLIATWLSARALPYYQLRPRINRPVVRSIMRYSANNYVAGLLQTIPSLLLPLIVVQLLGLETGAYFFVAWTIAQIVFIGGGAVATSYFAAGSHAPKASLPIAIRSLRIALTFLIPAVVVIFIFSGNILAIFGGKYPVAADTLVLLTMASLPLAFNEIVTVIKAITMDIRGLISICAVGAVAAIVLPAVFMGAFGLVGVGAGFLLAQLVRVAYVFWREKLFRRWKQIRKAAA